MITKSPFNYIGNKYRIMDFIQKFFPKQINTMVDLFCGGCDVSINTKAKNMYANDINYYVINICREFQKYDIDFLLNYINSTIEKWELTKQNKEAYLKFREHYNTTKNILDLYILMCYSFNYQFRFNSDHEFNNPFGYNRSSFNNAIRKNLIIFKKLINNIIFSAVDFTMFDYSVLKHGDFLYADYNIIHYFIRIPCTIYIKTNINKAIYIV